MMTREDFDQMESSQRQHHEILLYHQKLDILAEQSDMNLFVLLKPKIFRDGDQYCVLYGDDLQNGIAGFGDTIRSAIIDFNGQFDKKILTNPRNKEG